MNRKVKDDGCEKNSKGRPAPVNLSWVVYKNLGYAESFVTNIAAAFLLCFPRPILQIQEELATYKRNIIVPATGIQLKSEDL